MTVYGAPVKQPYPDVRFVPLHNMFFRSIGHLKAFRRALSGQSPSIIVVSRVYTNTNGLRRRFWKASACPDSEIARVVTIFSAVDIPERHAAKEKMVLFVGRIVPEKGALLYAQAMCALPPAFPDWRAQIVGGIKHGDLGNSPCSLQVAQEFAQVGSKAAISGYLPLPEVRALMGRASILCVPAIWNEPMVRVALEGMAEGALVATTGRGGLSEVVGDAGLIINSEDPLVWVESLRPWLASPERLRPRRPRLAGNRCSLHRKLLSQSLTPNVPLYWRPLHSSRRSIVRPGASIP